LVGMMHCAETREQARRDVEYGIASWFRYFQTVAGLPQMNLTGSEVGEMIDYVSESGTGVIGTPDDCKQQIERLLAQSNGGFGTFLLLAHEWANTAATRRSYELIAKYVMPEFQGQARGTLNAVAHARKLREKLKQEQQAAIEAMQAKHAAEIAAFAKE
ncbi:MAG: LLM class flavin-dependent oxidoreductase, partial [Gammaproteobacteria bacterium]